MQNQLFQFIMILKIWYKQARIFSNRSQWSIFLDYKESASTAAFVVISHDNLPKNLLLVVDGQMIVLN